MQKGKIVVSTKDAKVHATEFFDDGQTHTGIASQNPRGALFAVLTAFILESKNLKDISLVCPNYLYFAPASHTHTHTQTLSLLQARGLVLKKSRKKLNSKS